MLLYKDVRWGGPVLELKAKDYAGALANLETLGWYGIVSSFKILFAPDLSDLSDDISFDTPWNGESGAAIDVGVGADGTAWVVSPGHKVYRYDGVADWEYMNLDGATRLDVDPFGDAWVVLADGGIRKFDNGAWMVIPGSAMDIGVGADGGGSVWIIGTHPMNRVMRYDPRVDGSWIDMNGHGSRLDVTADGRVWIVKYG